MEDSKVWNDPKHAQALGKEKKSLEDVVLKIRKFEKVLVDSKELYELAKDESDIVTLKAICSDVQKINKDVAVLEFRKMFSNPSQLLYSLLDSSRVFEYLSHG